MELWNNNSTGSVLSLNMTTNHTKYQMDTSGTLNRNLSSNISLHHILNTLYEKDLHVKASVDERARELLHKPTWWLSFFIFIFGLLANTFTIQAICNMVKHHRSAHFKFVISLACSDILILVAICCGDFIYIFLDLDDDCIRLLKSMLLDVPLLATLLNLLAMAFDHYLASFRQLHYPHLMTKSRSNHLIFGIWFLSVLSVLSEFVIGYNNSSESFGSFCMAIAYDSYNIEYIIVGTIFVALIFIILIYIKIYIHVKRSLPGRPRHRNHRISPTAKTLVTTMLFIGTFVLFWTPEGIFQIYMYVTTKQDQEYIHKHSDDISIVSDILFLILQFNSLADPIIYAIRLPKVNQGLKVIFFKKSECVQGSDKCTIQLKPTNLTLATSLQNVNQI